MQFCDINIFFRALNPADVFGQTASYLLRMGAHILHVRSSLKIRVLESSKEFIQQTLQRGRKKKSHKGEMVERRAKTCCS